MRVVAATVDPTDLLFRSGQQAAGLADVGGRPPVVFQGMELAGVVHELGDQVTGLRVGQPVMGIVQPAAHRAGPRPSTWCYRRRAWCRRAGETSSRRPPSP